MENIPVWALNATLGSFKQLDRKISVEVAVIGGGITGITTAQLLKKRGIKTAVIESRKIGQGTTGQSTGNLYAPTEYDFSKMLSKYSFSQVQQVILSRLQAMETIRKNIEQFSIDCDFHLQPMYYFNAYNDKNLQREKKHAQDLGLPTTSLPKGFPLYFEDGFGIENQAQFNPLIYTRELAREIFDADCEIFEDTCINEIEKDEDFYYLKTDMTRVKARYVVHATHTPKGLLVPYHTALAPYREYGIAVKLKDSVYPEGIYWVYYGEEKFSIRSYKNELGSFLICIGSMHKVGQADDNRENISRLIDFVNKHFEVESVNYMWGGQNYKAADMLPYIGKKSAESREFIATGFSTDGLVYGTLAAQIISDAIAQIENPYAELYKANRSQPLKAAKNIVKENLNVLGKLAGDFFKNGEPKEVESISPNEGKLIQTEEGKFAVSKDDKGEVKVLSPICPHMGCTVHWNFAEKSWDCPCHGSRFDTNGKVIEGPSFKNLEQIKLKKPKE